MKIENGKLISVTENDVKKNTLFIPDSVTSIGEFALIDASGVIKKIIMSDSVVELCSYAFSGCNRLKYFKLSPFITSIPYRCFEGCSSLVKVDIDINVDEICNFAFYKCKRLKYVNLPTSMNKLNANAFYRCNKLKRYYNTYQLKIIKNNSNKVFRYMSDDIFKLMRKVGDGDTFELSETNMSVDRDGNQTIIYYNRDIPQNKIVEEMIKNLKRR